jgi:hypothetical protein
MPRASQICYSSVIIFDNIRNSSGETRVYKLF